MDLGPEASGGRRGSGLDTWGFHLVDPLRPGPCLDEARAGLERRGIYTPSHCNEAEKLLRLDNSLHKIGTTTGRGKAPLLERVGSVRTSTWEAITLEGAGQTYIFHREAFTKSISAEPPQFDMIKDRQVRVGYKEPQLGYYMDILDFITGNERHKGAGQDAREVRFPLYDDEWYIREAHSTPYSEDVLASIVPPPNLTSFADSIDTTWLTELLYVVAGGMQTSWTMLVILSARLFPFFFFALEMVRTTKQD
ncbi:hypothetical protein GGTG_07251 [Gaeumannomyces tritici R3-111a-1]|uniref:Uncharacterized protein n=1 Tax=Gaeumannomyces tritici (strain R3-111a-1) TaxID=644352 RepID=J3P154_GAET3|nr:hypothetical protein GGTG_07251 [Gaeumannomyces tritici R3-111a-1]EJT77339.1 hypothetical protein GGTG_07251 [Gaeumannomyces tritici R3-111a-1]